MHDFEQSETSRQPLLFVSFSTIVELGEKTSEKSVSMESTKVVRRSRKEYGVSVANGGARYACPTAQGVDPCTATHK
jgi:hypothetical protein